MQIRIGRLLPAFLLALAGPLTSPTFAQSVAWQQSFNPTTIKIGYTPADRRGLFTTADSINISTTDNGPIRVIRWTGEVIYSGPGKAFQLEVGHYFVETSGDRSQFFVLPSS